MTTKPDPEGMRYAHLLGQYLPVLLSALVGVFQTLSKSRSFESTPRLEQQPVSSEDLPLFGELSMALNLIGRSLTLNTKMMIVMIGIQMTTMIALVLLTW